MIRVTVAAIGLAALTACSSAPPQPVMYLHETPKIDLALDPARIVKAPISPITATPLTAPL